MTLLKCWLVSKINSTQISFISMEMLRLNFMTIDHNSRGNYCTAWSFSKCMRASYVCIDNNFSLLYWHHALLTSFHWIHHTHPLNTFHYSIRLYRWLYEWIRLNKRLNIHTYVCICTYICIWMYEVACSCVCVKFYIEKWIKLSFSSLFHYLRWLLKKGKKLHFIYIESIKNSTQ